MTFRVQNRIFTSEILFIVIYLWNRVCFTTVNNAHFLHAVMHDKERVSSLYWKTTGSMDGYVVLCTLSFLVYGIALQCAEEVIETLNTHDNPTTTNKCLRDKWDDSRDWRMNWCSKAYSQALSTLYLHTIWLCWGIESLVSAPDWMN